MAVENDLGSMKPVPIISSPAATSFPPHRIQVATTNSATFIRFPNSARQSQAFIPLCPSRTSFSSTPVSCFTTDSKSSTSPEPNENRRGRSESRVNPILSNPLLNHRREQPKTQPRTSYSAHPARLPLSTVTNRATTAPVLTDRQRADALVIAPVPTTPIEPEEDLCLSYMDDVKFDYISRWIREVRAATFSDSRSPPRVKRSKRRSATQS